MRFRPSTRTGKDAAMAVFFAVLSVLVFCFDIYPAPASGEGTKERTLSRKSRLEALYKTCKKEQD